MWKIPKPRTNDLIQAQTSSNNICFSATIFSEKPTIEISTDTVKKLGATEANYFR